MTMRLHPLMSIYCVLTVENFCAQVAFVYCDMFVFQKEIRQWLERVSAEQDVPVLWDDEKTPSK